MSDAEPGFDHERLAAAIADAAARAVARAQANLDAASGGSGGSVDICQQRPVEAGRTFTIGMVAARCGITRETLSAYVHGHRTPTATVLALLARDLSVSSDYLVGLAPHPREVSDV
jgi:hypothetical protein